MNHLRLHRRAKSLTARVSCLALAAATALSMSACMSDGTDSDGGEDAPIRIGATEAEKSQWRVFQEKAEQEGVNVEIVGFTDYSQPNRGLTEGELDVNQFQHAMFLADYNINAGTDIAPIGATSVFPLGVYAPDGGSLEDIAEAGEVVIPNDTVNQGRAIKVLAAAKLVSLRDDELLTPTPADIDAEASDVKVTPVSAEQTALGYNDGTPAVINNNFLVNAGVEADDAVYKDDPADPEAQPYINFWATTSDRVDDEDLQQLVRIWRSDEVQAAVTEDTAGTAIASDLDGPELREILGDTERKLREQNAA